MTISDYASLLVDAGAYSGRDDIAHLFPRFVALAEQKLNRSSRVADMEKAATLALTKGEGILPADFLEARQVLAPGNRLLRARPLAELTVLATSGGAPVGYAIIGDRIRCSRRGLRKWRSPITPGYRP